MRATALFSRLAASTCRTLGLLVGVAVILSMIAGEARAQNLVDTQWTLRPLELAEARETHRGIELIAMPLPSKADHDIPLAGSRPTVAKLKRSLDRVFQVSQVAARGIARLRKHGNLRIIYDAAFPKRDLSRVVIAAFLVGEWTPQQGKTAFTVIVGRYGANWPADELAAVLVHELIGHGIQRLENRFGQDRLIDLECQARLWQQLYYIKAGMPLDTREMVDFRTTTNRRVCHDFRRYVAKALPRQMHDWDRGRPDMARLLRAFGPYYDLLRKARRGRPAPG